MRKNLLIWLLLPALLLAGCTKEVPASYYALPSDFSLPQKTIYGLGEATHGSAEFTIARQNVFEYLVLEQGVRAFCLEAGFAEGLYIDGMLYGENWDARSTARRFGMWVYRHRTMADLLQWMRDYNSTAAPEERVRLYGIDCQYWDEGYTWLAAYLEGVSPGMAEILKQEPFSGVNDSTLYSLDPEEIGTLIAALDTIESELRAKEAALAGQEYDVALRVASGLRQCLVMLEAALDTGSEEEASVMEQDIHANNLRDEWMAEQVNWILAHEEKYYARESILVTGHNAHITKDNGLEELQRLGERLSEGYGGEYYAIGTDFGKGWFKAANPNGPGLKAFELGEGPLAQYFQERDGEKKIVFVEFSQLSQEEFAFFNSPQNMHTIGSVFSKEMQDNPETYLTKMIPVQCYDALIYFHRVGAFQSA